MTKTFREAFAAAAIIFSLTFIIGFFVNTSRAATVGELPVYRFWSFDTNHHFFTVSENEKKSLTESGRWRYEGVAFYAYFPTNCDGRTPMHRFWNNHNKEHFYTASENEKNNIVNNLPPETWIYEGVTFCVPSEKSSTTLPAFRFWNKATGEHFFTVSPSERDELMVNAGDAWTYEGAVFSAQKGLLQLPSTDGERGVILREYFGMHIHEMGDVTPWPNLPFGSLRMWDAQTLWGILEFEKGVWDFTNADYFVENSRKRGIEPIFTLGQTPRWAAARPDDEGAGWYNDGPSEPADMEDWRNYIRTLATRYKGKIKYYEIWNEADLEMFYTGTVDKMVELAREARTVLKSIDPDIVIVGPSVVAGSEDWLDEFFAKGGGQYIDAIAVHLYSDTPEKFLISALNKFKQVRNKYNLNNLPIWNTETGWCIDNPNSFFDTQYVYMCTNGTVEGVLNVDQGAAFVVRSYLLARANGVSRFYWYAWDDQVFGLTESDRKTYKKPAFALHELEKWLVGKRLNGCDEDSQGTWTCKIEHRNTGVRTYAIWNPTLEVTHSVPDDWNVNSKRDLNGKISLVGDSVKVGFSPILLF